MMVAMSTVMVMVVVVLVTMVTYMSADTSLD